MGEVEAEQSIEGPSPRGLGQAMALQVRDAAIALKRLGLNKTWTQYGTSQLYEHGDI